MIVDILLSALACLIIGTVLLALVLTIHDMWLKKLEDSGKAFRRSALTIGAIIFVVWLFQKGIL